MKENVLAFEELEVQEEMLTESQRAFLYGFTFVGGLLIFFT